MGVETTNGDGFGLDWYGAGEAPGLYRAIAPAWGDENLHELAAQIESPVVVTPHDEPHRAHHSPGGHTRGSRAARPRPKQGVCGGRRTVLPATAAGT
jgi:hypothetical protein